MRSALLASSGLVAALALAGLYSSPTSSYSSVVQLAHDHIPALFSSFQIELAGAREENSKANFKGRRAVVVGGTSGIGEGIALRLAKANFSVTVVGRNAQKGQEIVAQMSALGGSNHEFVSANAMLIKDGVDAFAADYLQRYKRLDVLVETQGIATMQGRTETKEGIDEKLALHYYGRIAMVDSLLPLLRLSPSPRVLSVLSAGVHGVYKDFVTDPDLKINYGLKNAADSAGLYNDVALDALARREENRDVTFVHAAPGFVNTNWGTQLPFIMRALVRAIQPFGTTMGDCAEFMSLPLLATDEKASVMRKDGVLLLGPRGQRAPKTPVHDEALPVVWKHTQELLARVRGRTV